MIIRSVKKEVAQREELAVANENQQLLIRFITHQVKGFFTKSKMVFASLLEGDFGQIPEAVTPVLKEGLESDNKAVEMVQEVLKASSLRSGTMTYNFEETDLKEFVAGIAETLKETAVGKGLAYEVNLPAEKALSKIDRLQMTQVIKNLIDNSVKYTLTGFVHVNLKVKNVSEGRRAIKTALFSVEDSGVGLSDGDKAKLFKEGGRGEESLKLNVNSTGYGLFIVKKIVEGHGGKIWAESRGRGHGTKFFVEIPLADSSLK
jgi:signal transduction histidine kinase